MNQHSLTNINHGCVIPARSVDTFPNAKPTIDALGIRMTYLGWPGLTRAQNGDLIVSASEHLLHVDPFGRDLITRSTDGGRTWTEPEIMFDSIGDDRDMSLNTMPDGTIIATWFNNDIWARPKPFPWMREEWEPLREQLGPDTLRMMHRGWLRRSTDGGRTWERLIHPTLVGQHAGPTPLTNGDLLYVGRYDLEDGSKMVATLSTDGGRTWQIISDLPVPRYFDDVTQKHWSLLGENHVIELSPGHLLAAFRGTPGQTPPNVHTAHSTDGGRTWSEPIDTGVFGHPPYLLKLASGATLCLTSQRTKPQRIIGMLSFDDGRTWQTNNLLHIADATVEDGFDMGYPVAVETSPGEIFCVYYTAPTLNADNYATLKPQDFGIRSVQFQLKA